jgi:hypothetical protein
MYKEIYMGSVAKSYIRRDFLILIDEEMREREYLVIYEKAVSHIRLCTFLISQFF